MNTDIRLSVDFFLHHKTKKVARMLGQDGVLCLVKLFCYTGKFRPDGSLKGMDAADISDAVDWNGDEEEFVSTLCSIGFLEECEEGLYTVHDWEQHNSWAAGAEARSLAASKAGKASAEKRAKSTTAPTEAERILTERSTGVQRASNDSPTPSPSPSPSPSPKDLPPKGGLSPLTGDDTGGNVSKIPSCPQQDIIALYHSMLPQCPQVKVWNDTSRSHLKARWRSNKEYQTTQWWKELFGEIAKSDFLTGKAQSNGGNPFVLSLSWLVKPANFEKVVNGNYANKGGAKQKRGTCTQCSNNYLPACKGKSDEERDRCNHFAEVEA